jgi:hypothetical protein
MTEGDDRQAMKDISHTNPYTGETFTTVYTRGPAVADGGATESEQEEEMKDIDHTPPHGDGANEVWERGVSDAEDDVDE